MLGGQTADFVVITDYAGREQYQVDTQPEKRDFAGRVIRPDLSRQVARVPLCAEFAEFPLAALIARFRRGGAQALHPDELRAMG